MNEVIEARPVQTIFRVGDRCRVREWDDMAREFGERHGYINMSPFRFVNSMRYLCGSEFTIASTHLAQYALDKAATVYRSVEGQEEMRHLQFIGKSFFYITSDMLELLDSPESAFDAPSVDWLQHD